MMRAGGMIGFTERFHAGLLDARRRRAARERARVLDELKAQPAPASAADLALALAMSRRSVQRRLKFLVDAGLVVREFVTGYGGSHGHGRVALYRAVP